MSGRHGGGYRPGGGGQGGAQQGPRHGGGYKPGQQNVTTYSTSRGLDDFSPAPSTYQIHGEPQILQASKTESGYGQPPKSESLMKADEDSRVEQQNIVKRPTKLGNYSNLRHPQNAWRWEYPNAHLKATLEYATDEKRRHQDMLGREWEGVPDDRYLSPWDGKVKPLVVQATDDLYNDANSSTYSRTFVRNVSPWMLRIATWPSSHLDYIHGQTYSGDYWTAFAKWIPSTIALSVMLLFPGDVSGQERNGGCYDVFPYKSYTYPKAARNQFEDDRQTSIARQLKDGPGLEGKRALRPRYLCVLTDDDTVDVIFVDGWTDKHPGQHLEYVFIAYTAAQFSHDSHEDMEALHDIAKRATKDAGVTAYWVGSSCMPDDDQLEQDVYKISDVIRGAHSLVIAVGPSHCAESLTMDLQVREWGMRMWTYPEVLLSPGDSIKIFPRNGKDTMIMPKRNFAANVWTDAAVSRQLTDHYEGSLTLSRLELVTLALQCLHNRVTASEYLPGDQSYALMGLLRLRPNVDSTDSAFQAFARLSLANDSDMLLERLISTLPKNPNQHWSCMDDAFGAKLWDIYPTCQIAGIGQDDTVIVDGLRGANVRWKSFETVKNLTSTSWKRLFVLLLEHFSPIALYTAIILLGVASSTKNVIITGLGVVLLIYSLVAVLGAPYFVKILYGGKFWQTQPWLFGFEGHLDIATVEQQIFGTKLGRLAWSPYSSPLSRHQANKHGECIGIDPTTDPDVVAMVEQARHARPGDQRIFTIVDTGNMEVTMFSAQRPPVAFLLAGDEGGMQRAIGVSYEWETATCYRETVMRLPTPTKAQMSRVNRVRFGLKRRMFPVRAVGGRESV
ncbi:unnamed protein product [Zymoseptoria tritici ST99CH_3D1]|nr:unnamed protein product [Zymoseptoria tritici ST99CH_3D1]